MANLVDMLLAEGEANGGKFADEPAASPEPQVEEQTLEEPVNDFSNDFGDINLDFDGTAEMSPVSDDVFSSVEPPVVEPVVETPQPEPQPVVEPVIEPQPVVEQPVVEPVEPPVIEQPVVEPPVVTPPVVEPMPEPQPVVDQVSPFIKSDVEALEDSTFNNVYTPTYTEEKETMAQMKWTEQEDELIRQHINRAPKKLQELLPNRTTSSIAQRKAKLKKQMAESKPKREHKTHKVATPAPTPAPAPVVETPVADTFTMTGDLEGDLFALASRTILKDIAKSHKSNIVTTESLREMVTAYIAGKDASFKNWKSVFESVLTEIIDSGYTHTHYGELTQLVLESVIDELQD